VKQGPALPPLYTPLFPFSMTPRPQPRWRLRRKTALGCPPLTLLPQGLPPPFFLLTLIPPPSTRSIFFPRETVRMAFLVAMPSHWSLCCFFAPNLSCAGQRRLGFVSRPHQVLSPPSHAFIPLSLPGITFLGQGSLPFWALYKDQFAVADV